MITPDPKYQTADGRKYRYPGKTTGYPGVTTVIGSAWPSGHLEDWRIGNIAKQCVENADALATRFKRISKKPDKIRDLYATGIKEQFIDWKDDYTAADRGTRIHEGLELRLTGENMEQLKSMMALDEYSSIRAAVKRLDKFNLTVEHVEVPVYCHDPKYAGTADIIGTYSKTVGNKTKKFRCVIDLKTGKRINKAYIPQLAAYARATELMLPDGTLRTMPKIHQAFVLHARPDKALLYRVDIAAGWRRFQSCHDIYTAARSEKGMELYDS